MLRYGGGSGQRTWLLHRITGLGILFYLLAHITDTFFVVIDPAWYDHTLALYGGEVGGAYYWPIRWAFRIGELGLIACVLFHSINGLRVVLFDFWPSMSEHRDAVFRAVVVLFWVIMLPVAVWVVWPLGSAPVHRPEPSERARIERVQALGARAWPHRSSSQGGSSLAGGTSGL